MSSRYNTFENSQSRARAQRRLNQPPVVATANPVPINGLTAALVATSSAPVRNTDATTAFANASSLFTPAQMEAVVGMVNALVGPQLQGLTESVQAVQTAQASSTMASAPMKIGRDNAMSVSVLNKKKYHRMYCNYCNVETYPPPTRGYGSWADQVGP